MRSRSLDLNPLKEVLRYTLILSVINLPFPGPAIAMSGSKNVVEILARHQEQFSVLTINLQGIEERYDNQTIPWRDRYERIAKWMVKVNSVEPKMGYPDFIVLQEVHGENVGLQQYETLFTLLSHLRGQTHIPYRIAYLTVGPTPQGLHTLWGGKALLYNSDKIVNQSPRIGSIDRELGGAAREYSDTSVLGVHVRKSLPCQSPPAPFSNFCNQIDGNGLVWVSSFSRPSDNRWMTGPILASFEIKGFVGSRINIINVHEPLDPDKDQPDPPGRQSDKDASRVAFDKLLDKEMENTNRLYPPIVLGDFNLDVRRVQDYYWQYWPKDSFWVAGWAYRDVIGVLTGSSGEFSPFPAKEKIYARSKIVPDDWQDSTLVGTSACGNVQSLWGDHCAVFVQFSPIPLPRFVLPDGRTATGNVMNSNEVLHSEEFISSTNGQYVFRCQSDGNMVLSRKNDGTVLWASSSNVNGVSVGLCRITQSNLVIYDYDGNLLWASGNSPFTGVFGIITGEGRLILEDDGTLRITRPVIPFMPERVIWKKP